MGRRKSQAKRKEDGLKRTDEVSSGEQVVVVVVLAGGEGGWVLLLLESLLGVKLGWLGRPFGRMTDSTDGRVPVPVADPAAVPGSGCCFAGETLASTRRGKQ